MVRGQWAFAYLVLALIDVLLLLRVNLYRHSFIPLQVETRSRGRFAVLSFYRVDFAKIEWWVSGWFEELFRPTQH